MPPQSQPRSPSPSPGTESAPPLLVVISGPSGVGKDSVLAELRQDRALSFVVTATDRPMRPGERDGYDYHFVSTAQFEQLIADDELIEWASVYGQYKGVPKQGIREALAGGRNVVLRIDVQGAATVRRIAPDALLIFIAPSSIDELRERLAQRATENAGEMDRRLATADREMLALGHFDYVIFNRAGQLAETVAQIRLVMAAEKLRVRPRHVTL